MSDVGKTEAELIKNRVEKVEKLRKLKINPYPAKSGKEYSNSRIKEIYTELIASSQTITAVGRVMAVRGLPPTLTLPHQWGGNLGRRLLRDFVPQDDSDKQEIDRQFQPAWDLKTLFPNRPQTLSPVGDPR